MGNHNAAAPTLAPALPASSASGAAQAAFAPAADSVMQVRLENGLRTLTLNRPRQANALNLALLDALYQALQEAKNCTETRVLIIAGAGNAFCAGHDVRELRSHNEKDAIADIFNRCSQIMQEIPLLPQPVIACVHGLATAAGCQLVAACDLAIAAQSARFATSGINLGLFCATPAVALSRNIGRKASFELLTTGAFIDAEEAWRLGLVNRVVADDELQNALAALTATLCAKPAAILAQGKRLFYEQLDQAPGAAYTRASAAMTANMLAAEAITGIDAFIAKKPPPWIKPSLG